MKLDDLMDLEEAGRRGLTVVPVLNSLMDCAVRVLEFSDNPRPVCRLLNDHAARNGVRLGLTPEQLFMAMGARGDELDEN